MSEERETESTGAPAELDFERTLKRLEEIVRRLDRDEISLDDAIALFKEGLRHVEEAHAWLNDASGRVEELIESASGALETHRFEDPEV